MFARAPRLSAIFDWELATIGDPLADVGYLRRHVGASRATPRATVASLTRSRAGPASPPATSSSPATRSAPGARCPTSRWYTTLALWKSAIFLEGSYKRRLAGTTDDPFFDRLEGRRAGDRRHAPRRTALGSESDTRPLDACLTSRPARTVGLLPRLRSRMVGELRTRARLLISQGTGQVAVRRAADRLEATAARSGYRRRRQLDHPPDAEALVAAADDARPRRGR